MEDEREFEDLDELEAEKALADLESDEEEELEAPLEEKLSTKKVGNIPAGFDEDDKLSMKDGKIFIDKA